MKYYKSDYINSELYTKIYNIPKIVFEGLDCSYKETNSKLLKEYLEKSGYKVQLISFPRYENQESIFERNLLSGKYKDSKFYNELISPEYQVLLTDKFYYLDMVDGINELIKNSNLEDKNIWIFDRYIYSMLYYLTPRYLEFLYEEKSEDKEEDLKIRNKLLKSIQKNIINDVIKLGLFKGDMVFKMKSDPTLIRNKAIERGELDEYEQNRTYLDRVCDIYEKLSIKPYITKKEYSCVYEIDTINKSREEIFDKIKSSLRLEVI